MSGHAFLAPSGAFQWGPERCAASARMQAQFPDPEGEEAKEGTVAHDYAANLLCGVSLALGWLHPNGYSLTQEMVDCTKDYVTDCQGIMALAAQEPGAFFHVESRVFGHQTINPHNDGTPDFYAVFPGRRLVVLKDYKHGHGYVSAFRNYQLINYLLMIFETHGLGVPDDSWSIYAAIYQPRNYHPEGHIREWRPKGSELAAWLPRFRQAAVEALDPAALATVGDWCRYCTAAHGCSTLQEAASFARGHASRPTVHVANPVDLGRELKANKRALALLKARVEAQEEQCLQQVAQGVRVPGWRGGYRSGRTKWNAPAARVIAWCKALGFDAKKEEEPKTPNQMFKLGLDQAMVESLLTTPTTFVLEEVTSNTLAQGLSENG